MNILGITCSSFNSVIDFDSLKRGGVRFAFVRMSRGMRADARGVEHFRGFKSAGIPVGAYHELLAEGMLEAVAEADTLLAQLSAVKHEADLFIVCKIVKRPEQTVETLAKVVNTFCKLIKNFDYDMCIMGKYELLCELEPLLREYGWSDMNYFETADDSKNYICSDKTLKTAVREYREYGAVEGCMGVYGLEFGGVEIARDMLRASLGSDETVEEFLEFARKNELDNIVTKIADRVCANKLSAVPNPLRLMSYEKQLMFLRWQCGLFAEEIGELARYRHSVELVHRICEKCLRG